MMMTKKLLHNGLFIAGAAIALGFLLVILLTPIIAPNDPLKTNIENILAPPGGAYPLGTDDLGRCILSRIIAGGRTTLGAALLVEASILLLGTVIGIAAGCSGGVVELVIITIIDILLAFPSIVLALVIAALLGAGLKNLMLAMILVYWVEPARIARSIARTLREKEFITAARAVGSAPFKIMRLHILPHVLPSMLIFGTLQASSIVVGISSLSFIGLGAKPPAPEWGILLTEARSYMQVNPWMLIFTITLIILSTASFQLIGEAMRDALNPRVSLLGNRLGGGRRRCS